MHGACDRRTLAFCSSSSYFSSHVLPGRAREFHAFSAPLYPLFKLLCCRRLPPSLPLSLHVCVCVCVISTLPRSRFLFHFAYSVLLVIISSYRQPAALSGRRSRLGTFPTPKKKHGKSPNQFRTEFGWWSGELI